MEKLAYFENTCPNCFEIIDDLELQTKRVCKKCLEKIEKLSLRETCKKLKENGKLKNLKKVCFLESEIEKWIEFFKNKTSFSPWSLQVTWAKRVFLNRSFSIIAPTGVGKTTWGMITASYFAKEGKKSYIVLPTQLLVKQVKEKLQKLTDKKIVAYTGEKKKTTLKAIYEGDFDILITTINFLYKHYENLKDKDFKFIFIDDVDSLLKSAKNIDKVLMLLGASEDLINKALEVIKLKKKLPFTKKEELDSLLKKINEIEKELEKFRESLDKVLVVSSATSVPKSDRVKLFREILGFEVGKVASVLRNVEDILFFFENPSKENLLNKATNLIKKYGKGCFLFISSDMKKEFINEVVDFLNKNNIKAISYEDFNEENKEKFIDGEIKVVVGIASYKNPLARGIDLPHAVRYAIFLGVPKLKFSLKLSLSPAKLFNFLLATKEALMEYLKKIGKDTSIIDRYINYLKNYITLPEELLDRYPNIKSKCEEIVKFLEDTLKDKRFFEILKERDDIFIEEENGELFLLIGDSAGYIQASGRTSRMFAGGLTKGASLLLVDNIKSLNSLRKRVRFLSDEIEFKVFESKIGIDYAKKHGLEIVNENFLNNLFKKIDKDREFVRKILEGKLKVENKNLIKTALVVVESPNKARTIANFFGKAISRKLHNVNIYEVNLGDYLLLLTASKGHIFDLTYNYDIWGVKKEDKYYPVYTTIKYCPNCQKYIKASPCPYCGNKNLEDKIDILKALRDISLEIDEIYLASDPDSITGDSKVLIKEKGTIKHITVEEFFNKLKKEKEVKIKNGHEIIELEDTEIPLVDNYKVRFGKAKYLIRHKVYKPIYTIKTKTGREIKITVDHSIFVLDKNLNLKEITPANLKIGDYIITNAKLPFEEKEVIIDLANYKEELGITEIKENKIKINGKYYDRFFKLDEEFASFIGLWIGDGSYHKNRYVRISCKDKEVIDLINRLAKRFNFNYSIHSDGITIVIHSKFLKDLMEKVLNIKGKAGNKKVPNIIFNSNINIIKAFLRGLFSADGTVSKGEANLTTISKDLKDDVVVLLLILGIIPKVYEEKLEDKVFHKIFTHGQENNKFIEKIKFLQDYKNRKLEKTKSNKTYYHLLKFEDTKGIFTKLSSSYSERIYGKKLLTKEVLKSLLEKGNIKKEYKEKIENLVNGDIICEKIKEISFELKEEYVYDFETETHNFIANNILCHNTEGEKIAWDVGVNLYPYRDNIKRLEFHEVTKKAFLEALKKYRNINLNLVKAQIVRRIADRWVGFALSNLLKETFHEENISAGRVQTPVLGWVIERDKEARKKYPYIKISYKDLSFSTFLEEINTRDLKYLEFEKLVLKLLKTEKTEKNPLPPYTTSEILKDASDKLKFSAEKTMKLLQEMFELGIHTYHRTDSTRVSTTGINVAKEYILEKYGEKYFKGRTWQEGGAHECIRPTRPLDIEALKEFALLNNIKLTKDHYRLYDLIFKRFIASQMKEVLLEESTLLCSLFGKIKKKKEEIPLDISIEKTFTTKILEDGFNKIIPLKVYTLDFESEKEISLPDESVNIEKTKLSKVMPYTQGTLIEEMKKRKIGRPSTYAQIIQTLLKRGYVIEIKGYLHPTKRGKEVYKFLKKNFEKWISEEFTRRLEEMMDKVEEGKEDYQKIIETFLEVIEEAKKFGEKEK